MQWLQGACEPSCVYDIHVTGTRAEEAARERGALDAKLKKLTRITTDIIHSVYVIADCEPLILLALHDDQLWAGGFHSGTRRAA